MELIQPPPWKAWKISKALRGLFAVVCAISPGKAS